MPCAHSPHRSIALLWLWLCGTWAPGVAPQQQDEQENWTNDLRIGGLFNTLDQQSVNAFQAAVNEINEDDSLLPNHRLVGVNYTVPEFDAWEAHRTVCSLLADGVVAVLGPPSKYPAMYVRSLLDAKEVPHLDARDSESAVRSLLQVNLYPHPDTLAKLLADVVTGLSWTSFTVVYEDDSGLRRLAGLIKMYDVHGYTVSVRQLPEGEDYRLLFRRLKRSGEINFVVDCRLERLLEVLVQLQQCGLLVRPFHFVFSNLDLNTLDLSPFQYGGANITGIRLANGIDYLFGSGWDEEIFSTDMQAALFHDGVQLVGRALHQLQHRGLVTRPLNCDTSDSWEHGTSLINYIRTSEVRGLSGLMRFDHEGHRSNILAEVLELGEEGMHRIGLWNASEGLNMTRERPWANKATFYTDNPIFFNKTLTVLIAMTPPYNMLKEASSKLSGNDRFEGFGVELIQELSRTLLFNYTFVVQEDGDYGTCSPVDGTCSGMMAEVDSGRADLAIVDLTITADRESKVDFTNPFLSLGIQILYRKPQKLPPSLMSFMSPFSNEVWAYMTAAYIGVSLLMFAMARISPYEWNNPYPCIDEPEELENQFSLRNAFWFTIGSLMQQGSEIAPIAASTRMAAGIWWFFTLIMVSSYTANLAAFLTVESQFTRIHGAEDLAQQTYIKYGAKKGGSTVTFFRESTNPMYRQMYDQMVKWEKEGHHVFPKSNEEGQEKVAKGDDYAFFMESVAIEYMMERNCNVTSVGHMLDEKGYGIAMKKNAPFRNAISAEVLRMQETGLMMEMKDKWWKNKRGGGACIGPSSGDVSELNFDNVGGVFVVLFGGSVLAVFIAMSELALSVHRIVRKENLSFRKEMMEELKLIGKCRGSVKPVRHRNTAEPAADADADELPTKRPVP